LLKVVPTERTYDSSTFAEKLGITPSTLRNYKSQFTKGGITFKNNKGKTIYTENNLHMFSAMLDLHKQGGMTIAECVHAVLSVQDSQDNFQESVITLKQYEDIIKRIEIQEQELQKCKAQIERRDRQVTELMRQMQELRKQASYKRAWWMFWKN